MDEWLEHVRTVLDLPDDVVDVDAVLDLAREAAHGVERPAAPVTTYLLGYALGRAAATDTTPATRLSAEEILHRLGSDAAAWADRS